MACNMECSKTCLYLYTYTSISGCICCYTPVDLGDSYRVSGNSSLLEHNNCSFFACIEVVCILFWHLVWGLFMLQLFLRVVYVYVCLEIVCHVEEWTKGTGVCCSNKLYLSYMSKRLFIFNIFISPCSWAVGVVDNCIDAKYDVICCL